MTFRLTRFVLCGCLVAACGCQNPLSRTAGFRDPDSFESRISFSSDDPSPLNQGRGHLPSLASEMADRRLRSRDNSTGIPGGAATTVKRLLERGYDADAHGRAQEARMCYEQILAEDPSHPDAHHRLGILADQAGDYAAAEQHYYAALRSNPTDADVLNDLGYSYFLQGRAAESERYLQRALQIAPKHPHVQENLSLLYNQSKAEKVLMSVMGPRQAQATLAQLFQNAPNTMPALDLPTPPRFAQRPTTPNSTEENETDDLKALRQKMEEARLQSITERGQRNAPQYPPVLQERMARMTPPPMPSPYPPQAMSQQLARGTEVPDGRINDVFRSIDAGGHSRGVQSQNPDFMANRATQMPVPQFDSRAVPPRPLPPMNAQPITQYTPEQRAAAPQWNTPPQQWPQAPAEPKAAQAIEQTSYTQYDPASSQADPRPALSSAAERAAEIGMSTGPGAMFPQWNSEENESSQQRPLPAMRSMPGTQSRMNGAQYGQPSGSGVPFNWDALNTARENLTNDRQPGLQTENRYSRSNFRDSNSQQVNPGMQGNPAAANAYEQMRTQQNSQFNQDQQYLAASPALMTNGHPGHEPIPGRFDPNQQDWPAYTREQYDTRNMNQPPTEPQPPVYGQGQFDGQTMPQINPAVQAAPQNYGRGW